MSPRVAFGRLGSPFRCSPTLVSSGREGVSRLSRAQRSCFTDEVGSAELSQAYSLSLSIARPVGAAATFDPTREEK
jgi:hypothetical protein